MFSFTMQNALDELTTCGDTEVAAANIRIAIRRLSRATRATPHAGNVTGFGAQFEVMCVFVHMYVCNFMSP